MKSSILIKTTALEPGMEAIGLVTAVCVMAGNIIKDTRESLRNLIGGEMSAYGQVIEDAIEIAISRLQEKAIYLDADAIVGFRITTTDVVTGGAEIIVYGTAVRSNRLKMD